MEWLVSPEAWVALVTLVSLEIVLGIDNIIFISILVGRLKAEQQDKARIIGLGLAMIMRICLVMLIFVIVKLTNPIFYISSHGVSVRDLILIVGGLFLLAKSTIEIHHSIEDEEEHENSMPKISGFASVLIQIMIIDLVFSLDSVITAVGMVEHVSIMVISIVVSVLVMMVASGSISRFINEHPTFKVLALSFLILIGVSLIGEGLHFHIPKGYLYFAMAFSVIVEMLNIKTRKKVSRKSLVGN
ncbi:MAG: hypothetical protein C0602_07080 [Denitrovibrio sp.]|nr:MAG: hypothetical protein C0602_07080 [Denitrovibrio sp.]